MKLRVNRWLVGLLVVVAVVGQALPALAHASLRRATPQERAVLQTAPADIRLLFDEELSGGQDVITVYGPDGAQVDEGETKVNPTNVHELVGRLTPALPAGGYRVVWRVVSVDGHVVEGTYGFSIGVAAAPPSVPGVHIQTGPGPLYKVLYVLSMFGLMTALGLTLFTTTALLPVLPAAAQEHAHRRWRRLTRAGLGLWVVSALAALPLKAAQATGEELLHLGWDDIGNTLANNRTGLLLGAQVAIALVGWLLLRAADRTWSRWLLVALGAVGLLGYSATGHAAALHGNQYPAIAADWLHLASVSLWWGGVLGFVVLAGTAATPQAIGQAVKRFSPQATVAVLVLVSTGLYGTIRHIPLWAGLTDTTYGWMLLAKLLILLPLLLLGAANQFKAGPRLLAAADSPGRFKRQVGIEVALLAIVIALGAVLANSRPAEAELLAQLQPGPLKIVQQQGDVTVQAEIPQNQVGMTKLIISVWQGGQPLAAGTVSGALRAVDMEMGRQAWDVTWVAPGRFEVAPISLGMAGLWELKLTVRVPGRATQDFTMKFLTPEGEG